MHGKFLNKSYIHIVHLFWYQGDDLSRLYRLYHKIPQGLETVAGIFKQVSLFILEKENMLFDLFDLL